MPVIDSTKGSKPMTQQLFTLADARTLSMFGGVYTFTAALKSAYPDRDPESVHWSIGDVAAVNLDDALWCLRLLNDRRQIVAAIMPSVKRASAHTKDSRVHDCIAGIDKWLAGDDSIDLKALARAARATSAAGAAGAAAVAAGAAAVAATYAAAVAASAATYAAAASAAPYAARTAECNRQRDDLIAAFPRTF